MLQHTNIVIAESQHPILVITTCAILLTIIIQKVEAESTKIV